MDLVSVIVPCYNSGETIKKTIESIQEQTWKNIEIIVVDDGSDELVTLEKLEQLNGIKILKQKNMGLSAARNNGIKKSKGDYILPLDADDWLDPNAIDSMLRLIKNTKKKFVFSNFILEGDRKGLLAKNYNFFDQLFLNQIPYCILHPKKYWTKVGGYDENMTNGYEDWEYNIRLGSIGISGICDKSNTFHYLVNAKGMLLSKSLKNHSQLWSYIQNKHTSLYKIKTIWKIWKKWNNHKSNHSFLFYFCLFILHKFLPKIFFNLIFQYSIRIKNNNWKTKLFKVY